jgi:hypothetical protein
VNRAAVAEHGHKGLLEVTKTTVLHNPSVTFGAAKLWL